MCVLVFGYERLVGVGVGIILFGLVTSAKLAQWHLTDS